MTIASPGTYRNNRMPICHHARWSCLVAAMFCLSFWSAPLCALAMGPGMIMVQNIPPGQEVDLHKLGGTMFTIVNRSDKDQDYNLTCQQPITGGVPEWEKGYEEISDPAWCRVEESVFTVPAHGEKKVGLIIHIPDLPELYNRKFMLAVVLKGGRQLGTSVGLAVACRVQIETAINDHLDSSTAAPLAVVPGTITVSGKPGAAVSGSVLVRNNTSGRFDATVVRLPQVYEDPIKHPRYYSNGFEPQKEPWLAPQSAAFPLDACGGTLLSFSGAIPATAEVGKKYEELAFVRATTADGKELMTFVRLHCQVQAAPVVESTTPSAKTETAEPAKAEPAKAEPEPATPATTSAVETPIKP